MIKINLSLFLGVHQLSFRDWPLITGRGGGYKTGGGGGHMKFYPYGIFFSHAEGGGAQKVFG